MEIMLCDLVSLATVEKKRVEWLTRNTLLNKEQLETTVDIKQTDVICVSLDLRFLCSVP